MSKAMTEQRGTFCTEDINFVPEPGTGATAGHQAIEPGPIGKPTEITWRWGTAADIAAGIITLGAPLFPTHVTQKHSLLMPILLG